ncbi:MAG: STAS domain-containing protein [Clostridiales bacterium]|nr:STAS domain-containing protein [Clostridiales bacterium]
MAFGKNCGVAFVTMWICRFEVKSMQIRTNFQNNVLYIELCGELDEHNAAKARREADNIADAYVGSERVVLDLREVSFMDSTGIGFLIGRYKKFRQMGATTYLANPSFTTDKILTMSGVYALMPKI